VTIDLDAVDTNIVVLSVADAPAFVARLQEAGVVMGALDATTVRAVTHLDVDAEGIERALAAAADATAQPARR
jgi:threonine aldolase